MDFDKIVEPIQDELKRFEKFYIRNLIQIYHY